MTQNEAIEKVLNLARAELGYHEKGSNTQLDDKYANSGSGNYTKYARDLDALGNFYNGPKNGFAWCDVFPDWLLVKCFGADIGRQMVCQPLQSAGAGCMYSVQYYKQAGRWGKYPQPGDQIFFSYRAGEYSHTGIVESVSNGSVVTIEGNSSDQVARRTYALGNSSIAGYGRPRWELVADVSADAVADVAPEAAPVPAKSGALTILRRGSKSEKVYEYQAKLIKLGYNLGRWGADGDFGADTYHAVKAFQKDHGVTVDGEIGPVTAAAIDAAVAGMAQVSQHAEQSAAKALADKIKPNPVTVVTAPLEAEEHTNDGYQFHIGDIVNFIGNGHYMSATAKVGFKCKPGKAMIRAVNRAATTKHPYRISAVRGGGSTVNGWVDEDALQSI